MKILSLIAALTFSIILISCSDNQKDESRNDNIDPVVQENSDQNREMKNNEIVSEEAPADFQEKVDKGEILLLTENGEPKPFEFEGNIIKTIRMPDGKQYQVEVDDDDKTWINIADKGRLQLIKLNDKMYLFDDNDQAYELKVIDNELAAEATSITKELLAIDDK